MRLLGCAHGGLQEVLDGDLVPQRLVQQPLAGRQLAVGQDLNLGGRVGVKGHVTNHSQIQTKLRQTPVLVFVE